MNLSRRNRGLAAGIGTMAREEQARTGAAAPRVTPSFTLVIMPILSPWIFLMRKAQRRKDDGIFRNWSD